MVYYIMCVSRKGIVNSSSYHSVSTTAPVKSTHLALEQLIQSSPAMEDRQNMASRSTLQLLLMCIHLLCDVTKGGYSSILLTHFWTVSLVCGFAD